MEQENSTAGKFQCRAILGFESVESQFILTLTLPHLAMRKQKLLDRLTNNPKGAKFHDLRTLLFFEGFQLERVSGSHHIFSRPDMTFVIPVHGNRVKSVYVRRVIKLLQQPKGKN